jgi:hypothetical protein
MDRDKLEFGEGFTLKMLSPGSRGVEDQSVHGFADGTTAIELKIHHLIKQWTLLVPGNACLAH